MKSGFLQSKLYLVILFSFVLLFITACNSEEGTSSEAEESDNSSNGSTESEIDDSENPTPISISLRTLGLPYVVNHPDINEDEYVLELEERTNTDLDIRLFPHSEFQTNMDLMFASGDIPDIVSTQGYYTDPTSNGGSLPDAVEAGVFLPLDDLIEEHGPNLKEYIPESIWELQRYEDGKIYSIPQILSNPSRRATVIRRDLLDEAGLDAPETVEETLEVLRAFKELGVEQPFVARENYSYSDTFFAAYDVQPHWILNDSGNPVPKFFDSENMKKAIGVYKTMYDEGLIHPEYLTQDSNIYKNKIMSGEVGMWSQNANALVSWQKNLEENVPDGKMEIIPSPTGPDGKGGYGKYNPFLRTFMISAETENPEKIIQFLDWMVSEEGQEFFTFGIEEEDYTKDNGEINYEQPEGTEEVNREVYRSTFLWLLADATYTEGLLEQTEEGKDLMNAYDEILAKEGRSGIRFVPPLDTFSTYPALSFKGDKYPDLLLEYIAKMITGSEDIDNWDKALEEWKEQGGNEILKEAKERYDAGQYTEPLEQ